MKSKQPRAEICSELLLHFRLELCWEASIRELSWLLTMTLQHLCILGSA
jgi:hypothetical protein